MTTRISLIAVTILALSLAACQKPQAPPPSESAPKATPPKPMEVQDSGEANPTGAPEGETPAEQAVDAPAAVGEAPAGTDMSTDQGQATALHQLINANRDAPRWTLTWEGGKGMLDLDRTTEILTRTLPDGTSATFTVSEETLKAVVKGERGWGG